jgi:hypothetical protein
MKYNSIEGIIRWYENGSSWEEWDVVKGRALTEWKSEMESGYKSGVEMGVGNRKELARRLEVVYKGLQADIETPLSSGEWFKGAWE